MQLFVVLVIGLQILGTFSLIIPDELPSLLSVVYSNIPTIKKGTDSRIGWGFRLGNRADFQVITELGPQRYTQPLGNQPDPNTNNKRNVENNLRNTLWALRQQEKRMKANTEAPKSEGGKWLKQWSESMEKAQETANLPLEPRPGLAIGEIDAKSVIPEEASEQRGADVQIKDNQVQQIVAKLKATTSKAEALDNVEI